MARTAKLEIEVDSRKAQDGGSAAARELRGLKSAARESYDELRAVGKASGIAAEGLGRAGRGASTADRELRRAGQAASSTGREMRGLAAETGRADAAMRRKTAGINDAINGLNALRGAAVAVIGVGLVKYMLDSADTVRGWNAQLSLAIPKTISLSAATSDMRRVAADTNSGITETNELYGKFSRSAQDLGKTQTEASRATETFAKTLKISGADTASAAAVTTQFGQALGSGVLRGDEFNSMMEASPRLARLLADSLGKNVGQLRGMAEEGELTADKLYKALTDKQFTKTIDEEFAKIPVTFAQAMVRIEDAARITFAAFDRGGEFSAMLIEFMLGGVDSMDTMERRAELLGVEMRATFAGLYDVFQPMTEGADSAFASIGFNIASAKDQIAGLLSMVDAVKNVGVGLDRAVVWKDNLNPFTADKPMPAWSNLSGQYRTAEGNREALGRAKVDEARVKASIPEYMRGDTPADLKAWMNGAYLDRKPVWKAPPKKTDDEKKAESEAKREAERQERLAKKRTQDEADFYQQLSDQTKMAAMLPREAERYNAELRLRKVLNDGNIAGERELSVEQKKRIEQGLAEKNMAEFMSSRRQDLVNLDRERMRLEDEAATIGRSTLANEEANLSIQQKLWPYKLDALERGLDLQNATVKATLAEVEARERNNAEIERRNQAVRSGVDVAAEYATPAAQQSADRANLERKKVDAGEALWAGRLTPEVYEATVEGIDKAMYEVDNRFRIQFANSIDNLAAQFDGKLGGAMQAVAGVLSVATAQARGDFSKSGVVGGVVGLFAGPNGNPVADAAARASQASMKSLLQSSTFLRPLNSLAGGFGEFKGDLKNIFGKGGDLSKGLGSVLGKAGMGAQMGEAVSSLAGLVGVKLNKTGSQVGGAVGMAVGGPIGGLIGSVGGGILGNLFSKPKQASAGLTFADGRASAGIATGNGKEEKATAAALSASVASGLNSLAEQLGGSLGSANVSIGYRPGHKAGAYRVDTSGRGKLTGVQAFETESEAIAYAIADAIKDGVLTGLSPTLVRIVQNAGTDLDRAVNDALKVKGVQDQYRQMTDPVNFALEGLNKSFEDLGTIMRNAGATAEEMGRAQYVYEKQRADIIMEGNNSALKQMREYLFALKGGTSSPLSPEARLMTARSELDKLDAQGSAVDFSRYQSTADAFLAASRDTNGSSMAYFADLKRVTDTVEALQSKIVTGAVTAPALNLVPVVTALDSQTAALTTILSSIDSRLAAAGGSGFSTPSGGSYAEYAVDVASPRYLAMN